MAIIYIARLSRPDLLLATTYLATKAQHPKEGAHKTALRIISYMRATINHGIKIACQRRRYAHYPRSPKITSSIYCR